MPIIPRFEQNFDPNMPTDFRLGEKYTQGMLAGAQAKKLAGEGAMREQMAEEAKAERSRADELNRAMVIAQQMQLGGQPSVEPRPEQFTPKPLPSGLGANAAYTAETMGYGGIPEPTMQRPTPFSMRAGGAAAAPMVSSSGLVPNFSPTRSASVVPQSRMRGMADLDAADRQEMDAVMRIAKEQGFGPTGTNALLQAVRGRSMERRQMFDVQQSQDAYQNALVGLERMSVESPALGEAMRPMLDQLKISLDQLDDNISPEERNKRILAFNASLSELNKVARDKRAQIKNYEATLATVQNLRNGYAPENPNFEMWTDVESELIQNPDMSVAQIGELMRDARLKDQGYQQDPVTGGWFTFQGLKDLEQTRIKEDARLKLERSKLRLSNQNSSMARWEESRPNDVDIAKITDSKYNAQFTTQETYDPESDRVIKNQIPVVDKVMSHDQIFAETKKNLIDEWQSRMPKFGARRGAGAAGPAAVDDAALEAAVDAEAETEKKVEPRKVAETKKTEEPTKVSKNTPVVFHGVEMTKEEADDLGEMPTDDDAMVAWSRKLKDIQNRATVAKQRRSDYQRSSMAASRPMTNQDIVDLIEGRTAESVLGGKRSKIR